MSYTSSPDILQKVGVNLELHARMIAYNNDLHERTHRSAKNRPAAMSLFDAAFHASHAERLAEIFEYRQKGGKSIGTFCIYVPDEIALAADVLPIPLCGGSHWPVDYADKIFPREICPLIRSTFGMVFSNTCPYKQLKDGVVGETTCDAKKKAWDLLGFEVMEEARSDPKLEHLPFIVISNLGQDSDIARAKELGAVDYFIKARILIDDLIKRIKSFLQPTDS